MTMNKIEHIGIAVKDLETSNKLFAALLGKAHYKIESVESEGVNTSFFQSGPNKIELLEATNPDSPIAKFIEKKGEGIHHIALAVDDIEKEIKRLTDEGFNSSTKHPKMALIISWLFSYILNLQTVCSLSYAKRLKIKFLVEF